MFAGLDEVICRLEIRKGLWKVPVLIIMKRPQI